mgnify:CR=1 FL=1
MDKIDLQTELLGKTLVECYKEGCDELHLITKTGTHYKLYHEQDCCENVTIEDICGDLFDLVGAPLIEVEIVTNSNSHPADVNCDLDPYEDSFTWTFYKLRTAKGSVTIRWYGTSSGYYSERVDVMRVK